MKTEKDLTRSATQAPLWGLILAGGEAQRMGQDKGLLVYHGVSQVVWTYELLREVCERAFVSLRKDQQSMRPYSTLPCIVDQGAKRGPAVGLLSAWNQYPEVAWFTIACDLPLLGRPTLQALIEARRPETSATAFQHADGVPEPLCTIWEPDLQSSIEARVTEGDTSLRTLLSGETITLVPALNENALASVNSPEQARAVRHKLANTVR